MASTTNSMYHDGCKENMIKNKSAFSQNLFQKHSLHLNDPEQQDRTFKRAGIYGKEH